MVSFNCKCEERRKPVAERNWFVIQHRCNHSAFNGYRWTPSEHSTVQCRSCSAVGRTKAAYVDHLTIDEIRKPWEESPGENLKPFT